MKNSAWRQAFADLALAYYYATGELWPSDAGEELRRAVKITLVSDALVRELYLSGLRQREIAELLGCSVSTVHNRLRAAGVETRTLHDYPETERQRAARERLAHGTRGPLSAETRRKISDARRQRGYEFGGAEHTDANGYVWVYQPEHPRANRAGVVPKHTLVMERALGRYLLDTEVVHHINRVRDDNRLDNLQLMDRHEHSVMHGREGALG